ncbi:MAG TPA: RDD family protein, partial [Rariglobus sp.]|nr:RDD family protein [Rariglobus sp.]
MQWYYAIDDQRLGPVSHAEFEQLVQAGKISGGALVWRKGMDQWKTLDEVKERDPALFAEAPPPLPSVEVHAAEVSGQEAGDYVRRAPRLEPEGAKPKAPEVLLYAGFWRRLGAHLVDLLAWWVVWQLFSGVVGTFYFPDAVAIAQKGPGYQATPDELMVMLRFFGVALVIGVIWAVIYDAVFVLRLGATPGKLLFGLRVVKANGQPLGFANVVTRCLAKGLLGIPTLCIGYLIVAFDEQKRG